MNKLLCALALFSTMIYSQSIGLGNTNPEVFTKYKLPQSTLHAPAIKLGGNFHSATTDNKNDRNNDNYNIEFGPEYFFLTENDDYTMSNKLFSSFKYSNSKSYDNSSEGKSTINNVYFYNTFNLKKYFSNDYFINTGLFSHISYDDNAHKIEEFNTSQNFSIFSKYFEQDYSGEIGIGFGKIRNISPVIKAIRFQERLKNIGHITSDLEENELLDLAQGFSRFDNYIFNAFRSGKNFWKDMESNIAFSKLNLQKLSPYVYSYAMEAFNELSIPRFEGYYISANIGFAYQKDHSFYPTSYWKESIYEQSEVYYSIKGEYSHQLSLDQQISLLFNFYSFLNINNKEIKKMRNTIEVSVKYDYELTDRFLFSAINSFEYYSHNNGNSDYLVNSLLLGFRFYFADKLSANFNYQFLYVKNTSEIPNVISKYIQRSHNISFGLTCYLGGKVIF